MKGAYPLQLSTQSNIFRVWHQKSTLIFQALDLVNELDWSVFETRAKTITLGCAQVKTIFPSVVSWSM